MMGSFGGPASGTFLRSNRERTSSHGVAIAGARAPAARHVPLAQGDGPLDATANSYITGMLSALSQAILVQLSQWRVLTVEIGGLLATLATLCLGGLRDLIVAQIHTS